VFKQQTQECSATIPVTLPIAMFSLIIFVILVIGIVFISMRNKMLHDRYELLVNEHTTKSDVTTEATWGKAEDEDRL